jgi:hypothetical protein
MNKQTTTIDPTKLTPLERKCLGVNTINKLTIKNLKKVLPQLEKFIGKKIRLADGNRAAIFDIELLNVPYIPNLAQSFRTNLQFKNSRLILFNDITLKNQDYEGGGCGVSYYANHITIANIDENGILTAVDSLDSCVIGYQLEKVYNPKRVSKLMKDADTLNDKLREISRELSKITNN